MQQAAPSAGGSAPDTRQHLFDLDSLSRSDIEEILETATSMQEILTREVRQVPTLRGTSVVSLFLEASTHTRLAFDMAAHTLSANLTDISPQSLDPSSRAPFIDLVRMVGGTGARVLVLRHSQAGAPYLAAHHFGGAIINAGDGCHAHPVRALLDLFTIRQKLSRIEKLNVVMVGNIAHSRVTRSSLWGLTRMGARVTLCAPPPLLGAPSFWHACWPDVELSYRLDEALDGADVIIVHPLRQPCASALALPPLREYRHFFALTTERLEIASKKALVLHVGGIKGNTEIDADVAASPQSMMAAQAAGGVAVCMALLYRLASAPDMVQ